MKLSKQETKLHKQAEDLVHSDKPLTTDEKFFVIENWIPDASHNVTASGAFFTPYDIAQDLSMAYFDEPVKMVDLCAGIGILSFAYFNKITWRGLPAPEITCLEINPTFVEVGKRVLPEATWIVADALTIIESGILKPKSFEGCLSNPPFGSIASTVKVPKSIIGRTWEYAIAEVALELADFAMMILPQGCLNWKMSGVNHYSHFENDRYERWSSKTGIQLDPGISIDTSYAPFRSTAIKVEIVEAMREKEVEQPIIPSPAIASPELQGLPLFSMGAM